MVSVSFNLWQVAGANRRYWLQWMRSLCSWSSATPCTKWSIDIMILHSTEFEAARNLLSGIWKSVMVQPVWMSVYLVDMCCLYPAQIHWFILTFLFANNGDATPHKPPTFNNNPNYNGNGIALATSCAQISLSPSGTESLGRQPRIFPRGPSWSLWVCRCTRNLSTACNETNPRPRQWCRFRNSSNCIPSSPATGIKNYRHRRWGTRTPSAEWRQGSRWDSHLQFARFRGTGCERSWFERHWYCPWACHWHTDLLRLRLRRRFPLLLYHHHHLLHRI